MPHTPTLLLRHDQNQAERLLIARLALARGERETWLRLVLELERFGQQSGSVRLQRTAWLERVRVATLNKHLDVAQLALQSAQSVGGPEHSDSLLPTDELDSLLIARQRLNIALGNFSAAVDDLLAAIGHAQVYRRPRLEIKLLLLLAMAQDGRKRTRLAMLALDQALRLAEGEDVLQVFVEEGAPLAVLLRRWVSLRCGQTDQASNPQFVVRLLQQPGIVTGTFKTTENDDPRCAPLTARETQVLRLLAVGLRNRAIAQKMFLSECTVKSHLHKINVKLGARSRTQALAMARERGWLD
jgi:LuxR family maltose regulon positive regulatory protein